jgi:hypothetical protein
VLGSVKQQRHEVPAVLVTCCALVLLLLLLLLQGRMPICAAWVTGGRGSCC